jgi:putative hydrolase of the HAD superfamily
LRFERYGAAAMPKVRELRGALLDLFGTLVPSSPTGSRAAHLQEMGRLLGVDPGTFEREWAASVRERMLGRLGSVEETIRTLAGRQGVEPPEASVRRALEVRWAFTRGQLDSCGPVLPALDGLLRAGMRLAVVSDTTGEVPRLWPDCPLASRFSATVFSCEEGFGKPDPRMYRLALERLALASDDCVYVGDGGSRELTGANAFGLRAFRYRFPGPPAGPGDVIDPDTEWTGPTLSSLTELLVREGAARPIDGDAGRREP